MPVGPDGYIDPAGLDFFFTSAPFRFCQNCGVSYRARRGDSDFGRLATLSSGGRSTATTILSLSIVRMLKKDASLQEHAKKLLSFTDNRQDASLQAGHFNDFVEVSLLRSALYKAALATGSEGVSYDELALRIFKALDLPLELYAREPGVQFAQKADTDKAMRNVIGYRIYFFIFIVYFFYLFFLLFFFLFFFFFVVFIIVFFFFLLRNFFVFNVVN